MERSIFTIEEDTQAPSDLQVVYKRYIRGNDEALEVGSDLPMPANYDEDIEEARTVDTIEGEPIPGEHPGRNEILWTKRYQSNVHEGTPPAEDKKLYDMIEGFELLDDFMTDPACEVPGMVRHDSGMGADQYHEPLLDDSVAPPAERDIYRSDFLQGIEQLVVPIAKPPTTDPYFIGQAEKTQYSYPIPPGYEYPRYTVPDQRPDIILSTKEIDFALGELKSRETIFKKMKPKIIRWANQMKGSMRAVGIGFTFTLSKYTPPPYTPFKNLKRFLQRPPSYPSFGATKKIFETGIPTPPKSLAVPPKFTFTKPNIPTAKIAKMNSAFSQLKSVVTMWSRKSPPWKFSWREDFWWSGYKSYSDRNFVKAMVGILAKLKKQYKMKSGALETWNNFLRIMNYASAVRQVMSSVIEKLIGSLSMGFNALTDAGTNLWGVLKDLPTVLVDSVKKNAEMLYGKTKEAVNKAMADVQAYAKKLKTFIGNLIDAIKSDLGAVRDWMINWTKGMMTAITKDATELSQFVVKLVNGFMGWVKHNITKLSVEATKEIKAVIKKATDEAKKIVSAIRRDVEQMVNRVKKDFTTAVNKLKLEFQKTMDKITASFNEAYTKLTETLSSTIDVVKKQSEIIVEQIKKVADIQERYDRFVESTGKRFTALEDKLREAGAKIPTRPRDEEPKKKRKKLFGIFGLGKLKRKLKNLGQAPAVPGGPVRRGTGITYPPAGAPPPAPPVTPYTYPPTGSPPTTQWPYAYPGAPRYYGTPTPWYDYPYTEVDIPALTFNKGGYDQYKPAVEGFY